MSLPVSPLTTLTLLDQQFMTRALQLARRGLYTTRPNPHVGCVLVKNGECLAEGWHYRAGEAHAEIDALQKLSPSLADGATAYVTLEPCAHQGRTGSCALALIQAKVARVVYAMEDPNPLVSAKGLALLREAGITVDGPLLASQAEALNQGFISRMKRHRPWVRCKIASSLDGRTAMASGESQWITGAAARKDVQQWRAQSCAIITGIGTVGQDNSRLTVRVDELELDNKKDIVGLPPLRVVLDTHLAIQPHAALLAEKGPVVVFTGHQAPAEKEHILQSLWSDTLTIERVAVKNEHLDLAQVLQRLAEIYHCNTVLIEAGARLSGAFLQAGLIDELIIYQAPILLGSDARSLVDIPLATMSEKIVLEISDQRFVGDDIRIIATLKKTDHDRVTEESLRKL